MTNDFKKMVGRALEIKAKYNKIEPKKWEIEQYFMGLVKDVGGLSKILMTYRGFRDDLNRDAKESLEHELVDIIWSVIVIADKAGIDLEESFYKTMDELNERINNSDNK